MVYSWSDNPIHSHQCQTLGRVTTKGSLSLQGLGWVIGGPHQYFSPDFFLSFFSVGVSHANVHFVTVGAMETKPFLFDIQIGTSACECYRRRKFLFHYYHNTNQLPMSFGGRYFPRKCCASDSKKPIPSGPWFQRWFHKIEIWNGTSTSTK